MAASDEKHNNYNIYNQQWGFYVPNTLSKHLASKTFYLY